MALLEDLEDVVDILPAYTVAALRCLLNDRAVLFRNLVEQTVGDELVTIDDDGGGTAGALIETQVQGDGGCARAALHHSPVLRTARDGVTDLQAQRRVGGVRFRRPDLVGLDPAKLVVVDADRCQRLLE